MQKFTLATATANKDYKVDVVPGQTFHLALSGTRSTAVITVNYLTAPGVFASYVPALTLSATGYLTGVNVGAHSEINVNVASAGALDNLILIANTTALQER